MSALVRSMKDASAPMSNIKKMGKTNNVITEKLTTLNSLKASRIFRSKAESSEIRGEKHPKKLS
eukprot:3616171-Rhodomonas_salina.1